VQEEKLNIEEYSAPLLKENIVPPDEIQPVSPNNPPWSSFVAFAVWLFSVGAIIVLPAIFLIPYMLANRQSSPEILQKDSTAILLNIIAVIPAHLLTLGVAWLVATRGLKFSVRDTLGLESGGFQWWYYPLILIAFFAVAGIVGYFIPEGDNELLRMLKSSRTVVILMAILATFTAPVVEEVVYRGILYSAFQRSFGVGWAVLVVTLLFAAVHVPQYWGSPGTILLICLLSLVLTLIRVKTDNLLPCIIMHTIFNGIQSVLLIAEPYLPKPDADITQPAAFIFKMFM